MCAALSIHRDKLALVIGINKYQARNDLRNPENDARDMANALRRINFNVTECLNATYADIEDALKRFTESIKVNDMVLFFFAGHGQQWEDQNYLIPSDDDYIEGETIKHYAFNVQEILSGFGEKKPFVVIALLDCCRDYHLRNRHLLNVGRGSTDISNSKGFRRIYISSNTTNYLIAFACAAGHIALDISSNGRNGLYTWHLLQHIEKPNEDIGMLLRDVARGVFTETCRDAIPQDPWLNCALKDRNIFLNSVPNLGPHLQARENNSKISLTNELNELFDRQLNLQLVSSNENMPIVTTEKNYDYESRYAKDYHTIKVLGKGSYGLVFEVFNKLDGRRLAVKRISLKNERQERKALQEVQALAQLEHPHVIRYLHSWMETPSPEWQKAQDDTYDWRDVSRNDRDTATDSERTNTNTSTLASTNIGTTCSHTVGSSSDFDNLDCFLKMPSHMQNPRKKDASNIGDEIQESGGLKETNKESEEPVVSGLVDLPVVLSSDNKNDQQITNETSPVQIKQDSMEKTKKISYLYYSMELCNDDTLEGRLSPSTLTKKQTCDILRQITETIAYIHEKKMIHGDIKPANIFFSTTDSIKIGDFGLVIELLDSAQAIIEGRRAHGTPWYMAPELRKKEQEIHFDEKVDIYAMGIVFLELLAPFKTGTDRSMILEKIRKYTRRNLDVTSIFNTYEKAIDFNLPYEPIIARLLNPVASERPSAKELLEDKSFLRLINGIHVDKFLPSASLIQEIRLSTTNISHGQFACSEHEILLCENNIFSVINTSGQVLCESEWSNYDYQRFGFISCIIWSVNLKTFLVLSHRALFTFTYSNFEIETKRLGSIYAPNKENESKLRFITCTSQNDYLFLNRGYHTIQQYKIVVWTKHREWTKKSLNYSDVDTIRDISADRNGEYLVMNVRKNGTSWVVDVRATDEALSFINRIDNFHHKLQLLSPCDHWLFVRGDPNRLFLYDIRENDTQISKEVLFGDNEDNPQFSFSKTTPINFRWLGSAHLVLGTVLDGTQSAVLKLYRI